MPFVRATASRRRFLLFTLIAVPLLAAAAASLTHFLADSRSDFGGYAARLTSRALAFDVQRRVVQASADARLATSFAGASPELLRLMEDGDSLLARPFLVSDGDIRRATEGDPSQIITMPGQAADSVALRVSAPRSMWRALVGAVHDTIFVVPQTQGERPLVLVPLVGFEGHVVAAAGWELHAEVLRRAYLERLLAARVFGDPAVYHAERISSSLSLSVYDDQNREVYRTRPSQGSGRYAEAPVGSLLPGWRVSVGPAAPDR
ncbi:MAG TPA: hypothetical protein VKF80_00830 [Candidatus Eisenbacteria bacterium]|nr:hypothetical protein [Candidatus Eisenbacteria bacterium]